MSSAEQLIEHVSELRRRIGSRRELHRTMAARGLGLSSAGVPEGDDVTIDGVLESIPEGVVVAGTVTVPWTGECRRCLGEVHGTAIADIREIFETHPTDGETWPLAGDHLDLAPLVHDTVLLTLPLAPLCTDACRGPAPELFPAITAEPDPPLDRSDDQPARDPRWAALDQLRPDSGH